MTASHNPTLPPQPRERLERMGLSWLVVPALAFAALVYFPITANYFTGDDFINLYQIADFDLRHYLLVPNGGHVLVARNAVFAVMVELFGLRSEYYFWCALLTHLLNVYLLFRVITLSTASPLLASFGAALWGISPLHQMTLGYYAVFGHVMVVTCLLVILVQALRLAEQQRSPSRPQRMLWYGLALVAATSFGTGTGIAAVLPFALFLLLPAPPPNGRWHRLPLASLVLVIPLLYLGLLTAYAQVSGVAPSHGQFLKNLFVYSPIIAGATLKLAAFGLVRLLLGFWVPSWSFLWLAYLVSAILLAGIFYCARNSPAVRRQLLAWVLLLLGGYLAVAIGRGAYAFVADSAFLGKAPHYHYSGTALLTIVVCGVLARLGSARAASSAPIRALLLLTWYGVSLAAYAAFGPPIEHHTNSREKTVKALAQLRETILKVPEGQPVYIKNRFFEGQPNWVIPVTSFPGLAAAFCIYFPENVVEGRRVYFIESNPNVLALARHGRRTNTLLVRDKPAKVSPPHG